MHRQLQKENRRVQSIELLNLRDRVALSEVKASLEHHVISLACLAPIKSMLLLDQYEIRRQEYENAIAAPMDLPSVVSCTAPAMFLTTLVDKVRAHNDIIKKHFNTMLCHSFCIAPASHLYNQCSHMLWNLSRVDGRVRGYARTHLALSLLRDLDIALSAACDDLPQWEPPLKTSSSESLGAGGPLAPLVLLLSGQLLGDEPVSCTEPSVKDDKVGALLPPPSNVELPPVLRCLLGSTQPIDKMLYQASTPSHYGSRAWSMKTLCA